MSVKFTGKWQHQCELGDAIVDFRLFWMPYDAPEHWRKSWEDFKDGLFETGWISEWQHKNWHYPEV
jgi:hypothetical protein